MSRICWNCHTVIEINENLPVPGFCCACASRWRGLREDRRPRDYDRAVDVVVWIAVSATVAVALASALWWRLA